MGDAQFNEWITVNEKEDLEMIRLGRTPANFSHTLRAASRQTESGATMSWTLVGSVRSLKSPT